VSNNSIFFVPVLKNPVGLKIKKDILVISIVNRDSVHQEKAPETFSMPYPGHLAVHLTTGELMLQNGFVLTAREKRYG
jgi:hypothetical protein